MPLNFICLSVSEIEPLYELFWKTKALPTTQHFTWRVIINKVATRVNLQTKRVILVSRTCAMCHESDEAIAHLLFTCRTTTCIWKMCDLWARVEFAYHNIADIHFYQFGQLGLNNKCKRVWKCMWMTIISTVIDDGVFICKFGKNMERFLCFMCASSRYGMLKMFVYKWFIRSVVAMYLHC